MVIAIIAKKTGCTAKYSVIHGFYWSILCSNYSFASVFLLAKHFSNGQIGLVLALANIFAVFFQPAVAAFADRTKRISMKGLLAALTGLGGLFATVRCFISESIPALAAVLILELTVFFALQPLINALGMKLIDGGADLNYGLARGIGSMSYAVLSVLLGVLAERAGAGSLPIVSVVFYLMLGGSILLFVKRRPPAASPDPARSKKRPTGGFLVFLRSNKRFAVLAAAVTLIFCSHTMVNNYLIQIIQNVGGTTADMGIAQGISAAVEMPAMIFFGYLVKKIRCSSILKFSLFFFSVKAGLMAAAGNLPTLFAAQLLQCCAYALFIPASVFYVNAIIGKSDAVKGQAVITSAVTLGGVAASLIGGWILDGPGVRAMLCVGTLLTVVGFVIGLFAVEKTEKAN